MADAVAQPERSGGLGRSRRQPLGAVLTILWPARARAGDDCLQGGRHSGIATVEIGSEQAGSQQAVLLGDGERSCVRGDLVGPDPSTRSPSTTADKESSGDLRFIHHGLSPLCRGRLAVTVKRPPTCACIHARSCSVRPATAVITRPALNDSDPCVAG